MSSLLPGQFRCRHVADLGAGGLGRVDRVMIVESNLSHPVGSVWARKRMNERWTAEHLTRFDREIGALQAMSHPNIVACHGENLPGGDRFYLMTEYPTNLRRHLAASGSFKWRDVLHFGATIADALAYAHELGFIHRDLKPENVLMTAANEPVVADWGLGYFVHQYSKVLVRLTRGGMGTEYYCSSEQWSTGKCGPAGDVYSLGMTLAELIEGVQRSLVVPGWGIDSAVVIGPGADHPPLTQLLMAMTVAADGRRLGSMSMVASYLREVANG